ncbi:MAG: adenosine kinase [Salinivirgaceae bacterium]|nr:adenosine kinase [Salinivirgaceae bacterium]MDD4745936.1 adenosine kinase [Salinivirgaceae bacterium]
MMKILGMGNALVDILVKLGNDDVISELGFPRGSMQLVDMNTAANVLKKTSGLPIQQYSGGSAANTIHGLANLGIETGFIGKVGHDTFGAFFNADLEAKNIKSQLQHSDNETGRAVALVSPDGERTFATYLGAAVELSANDLKSEDFKGYSILHIEGYLVQNHDLMTRAMQLAKENGLKISLDLASFNVVEENIDFLKNIVCNYVDILFANEEEAKSYTGKNPMEALKEMGKQCKVVVVKIGKEGSLVWLNSKITTVGVIDAIPMDTTGAGDLYASGFLYGLLMNKTPEECGWYGAVLSGNVIENIGAKISNDRWAEIKQLIYK